jgi:hypothetical protein
LPHEFLIQFHPIGQEHIGKGAFVLVVAVRLDGNVFPESEGRGGLLGALAERLAFLRAVDAAEADTFRVLVVQDFEGVAVEDGNDEADVWMLLTTSRERSCLQEERLLQGTEEHLVGTRFFQGTQVELGAGPYDELGLVALAHGYGHAY